MTEPKKFKRGKHTYTRWGRNFKVVSVDGKKKGKEPQPDNVSTTISVDMDSQTATGVYSNMTMVHKSDSEVILDFVFLPPGRKKGRLRSRVVLSEKQLKKLANTLNKAAEDLKN